MVREGRGRYFTITRIAAYFKDTAITEPANGQMKKKLLSILVCPLCKGPLIHKSRQKVLICENDKLAYPVRNGIPVLLDSDAKKMDV